MKREIPLYAFDPQSSSIAFFALAVTSTCSEQKLNAKYTKLQNIISPPKRTATNSDEDLRIVANILVKNRISCDQSLWDHKSSYNVRCCMVLFLGDPSLYMCFLYGECYNIQRMSPKAYCTLLRSEITVHRWPLPTRQQ